MTPDKIGYVVEEKVDPFTPTWQAVSLPLATMDMAVEFAEGEYCVGRDIRIALVYQILNSEK